MRNCLLLLFFFCGIYSIGQAQFYPTQYRPPQQWQQLDTPHFKLVYGRGNDSTAFEMARILEEQYPRAQELVGGQLSSFPVILNHYNDLSNGFVTPLHFRSEIELPPIKGKTMNPQTGGWLKNVGPHELVHALQFSNLGTHNIPRLINLFSPDLARSFHAAIPSGITEGLAVYHETEAIAPRGGRGQFPIFTNQFNAAFNSDRRWSMGQMVQVSSDTRPLNRHYIGGYAFTSWLQHQFGAATTRSALDFYMDFPFLGYGVALRHATGLWPGQLYNRFEAQHNPSPDSISAEPAAQPLNIPFKGREIRRPKWLSDSTLVFYGSFYNARSGFYRYDLESENLNRLITTNSVGDYRYDLSADRTTVIYSYYDSDVIYDNTYKAELVEYNFASGEHRQITDGGRLYSPQYVENQLLALQTRPASSALVSVAAEQPHNRITELLAPEEHEITAVTKHPADNRLAVVAHKDGMQGLWIVRRDSLAFALSQPPVISFKNGSVFDPSWHPSGQQLLFSSDFSGIQQLYEYDLHHKTITELTQAAFNAFEGAYSPDGTRIAFIKQLKNERLPVVIQRNAASGRSISGSRWKSREITASHAAVSDSVSAASGNWTSEPYSAGPGWLKPRAVLPSVREVSNSGHYQLGLSLHSNNLLQSQAYAAEVSYLEERVWYDVSYENKQFYPGFRIRLYSEPSYFRFSTDQGDITTLLRQNRSLAFSVPFDIQLNQNIYLSSLFIEPEFRYSQILFMDTGSGGNASDFANSAVSNLYTQLNI